MNNQFTPASIISRHESIIHSKLDDEIVMLSIEKGKYFGLNPVGSRIWELIEEPKTVSTIISTLADEYEVSLETCEKDLLHFLSQMAEQQIIQTRPG